VNVVALIPAKGRSSRVPGKNLRFLGGRPLVEWTIDAALGAASVSRVIVSTEDGRVALCARRAGAEVLARPEELAEDGKEVGDVVRHALAHFEADALALLLPTSPFRTSRQIDECVSLYLGLGRQTIASSVSAWTFSDASPGVQQRPVPNGAIWVVNPHRFRQLGFLQCDVPYGMDAVTGLDINHPHEFAAAEWIAENSLVGTPA
jgi:CMP-2-keto-3-deoxyoctulosonic acid synthetase